MLARYDGGSIFCLLLALIAVNIELDVFLPSLPQMREYFQVEEGTIEWVISINFFGLCLSGIFSGWLSDTFGRKKLILIGLAIFVIGSMGCLFAQSFPAFLAFRLLQGIGCGPPATVSFAAISDIYSGLKAVRIISLFNGVITIGTVGAPLIGVMLINFWGWQSNFVFIAILSVLAFLFTLVFFKETLNQDLRQTLNSNKLKKEILFILFNAKFWSTGLIAVLMYSSLVVFLANFSLLTVNHLNITKNFYSWLQASIMASFVVGSFLAVFFISSIGSQKLTRWGIALSLIGSSHLFFASLLYPSLLILMIAIICFNIGAAFLIAIFSNKVMELFHKSKGLVASLIGSLRMLISALAITISSLLFDGTFVPLGWLIFLATLGVYALITLSKETEGELNPTL